MNKTTFKQTKPKIFYDLMKLFEKINSANKNIAKYDRTTVIEPFILSNMAAAMRKVSTKIYEKNPLSILVGEAIQDTEMAREFFMFYTQNTRLNYNQNFILEVNLEFESIIKQLNGWRRTLH